MCAVVAQEFYEVLPTRRAIVAFDLCTNVLELGMAFDINSQRMVRSKRLLLIPRSLELAPACLYIFIVSQFPKKENGEIDS